MNTSHSSPTFEIALALVLLHSLAINRHAVRWQKMERDLVNFPELGGQSSIDRFDNGAAQSGSCHSHATTLVGVEVTDDESPIGFAEKTARAG